LADGAFAGWMGFRNDTKETIVIQETITVNGQPRPGNTRRLFSGEAVRDVGGVGQRQISVFDLRKPNKPIYTGSFPCPAANENILYLLTSDGKGGITVDSVKTPVQLSPIAKKK
jgi:hypothetical protein